MRAARALLKHAQKADGAVEHRQNHKDVISTDVHTWAEQTQHQEPSQETTLKQCQNNLNTSAAKIPNRVERFRASRRMKDEVARKEQKSGT